MHSRLLTFSCIWGLCLTAPPVAAQFMPTPIAPTFQTDTLITSELGNNLSRETRRAAADETGEAPSATLETGYSASPAVTRRVRGQFIDWVRSIDAAEGEQLARTFEQNDPIGIWSGIVREDGLRSGDVADSFAAYWILNWLVANQQLDSTPAQAAAVRNQVKSVLASSPTFQAVSDDDRQEMAEVFMLNFVIQHGGYSAALQQDDDVLKDRLSEAAVKRFEDEMGLNLRQLRLSERGFVAVD